MKLRKAQTDILLTWIGEGLDTAEINERAAKFKPRFKVSKQQVDYYRKKTLDLYLRNSGIPASTGFLTIDRNDGEMENRGFDFLVDYTVVRREYFTFSFNLNLSR